MPIYIKVSLPDRNIFNELVDEIIQICYNNRDVKIFRQRREEKFMETIDNSLFPIRMGMHIFLGLLALLVFGLQFIRYRKWHHLVMAIAMPSTLLPYLVNSMDFFYGLGIAEFGALILSCILTVTVDKTNEPEPEPEAREEENGT